VATAAARRYAEAVFDLASEEGRVPEWQRQLAALRDLISDPTVEHVLTNPTIPAARRLDLIAAPKFLDPEATNLSRMLIETGRVGEIAGIVEEYENLADEAAGRVRATVTTAVRLGKEVRLTAAVDRRIVGGLKLQYGDHLIDASLANRLQQLRRRLADAS
jgi:F-type H+-transporting ATPase subunit delta